MDPRKVCLGEVVAPGIIFLFGELTFMYLFCLLVPFAQQVEHGDRNAAGIRRTQAEGAIDIRDPEAVHVLQREQRVHQAEFRVDIRYLDGPRRYAIHFGKLPDQRLLGVRSLRVL